MGFSLTSYAWRRIHAGNRGRKKKSQTTCWRVYIICVFFHREGDLKISITSIYCHHRLCFVISRGGNQLKCVNVRRTSAWIINDQSINNRVLRWPEPRTEEGTINNGWEKKRRNNDNGHNNTKQHRRNVPNASFSSFSSSISDLLNQLNTRMMLVYVLLAVLCATGPLVNKVPCKKLSLNFTGEIRKSTAY